jgi:hypothetical protein
VFVTLIAVTLWWALLLFDSLGTLPYHCDAFVDVVVVAVTPFVDLLPVISLMLRAVLLFCYVVLRC